MPTDNTLLTLAGVGVPPYAARGLHQTLQPIGQITNLRRTVNGVLQDVSDPLFKKFQSVVSGDDMDPPVNIWPGTELTVGCVVEIAVAGTLEEATDVSEFPRTPVAGSVRHADGFTFFRPSLTMRVTGLNVDRDEWGASVKWALSLEEV